MTQVVIHKKRSDKRCNICLDFQFKFEGQQEYYIKLLGATAYNLCHKPTSFFGWRLHTLVFKRLCLCIIEIEKLNNR